MRFLVKSWVIGRGADTFSISMAIALASKMPTQMGMTVSEPTSLSTTIGILVDGSIIKPRIRTSMSMVSPSLTCLDGLADQAVGKCVCDFHLHIRARSRRDRQRCREVYRLVLRTSAGNLTAGGIHTFDH